MWSHVVCTYPHILDGTDRGYLEFNHLQLRGNSPGTFMSTRDIQISSSIPNTQTCFPSYVYIAKDRGNSYQNTLKKSLGLVKRKD